MQTTISFTAISLWMMQKPTLSHLKKCLSEIQLLMNSKKLKLNPSKTEFMVFSAVANRKKLERLLPTHILGERFEAAESVQNLGVIFDCAFSFTICRVSDNTYQRWWPSQQQMHCNYCDSQYRGLQSLQNAFA